jgi:hypothetical protein
MIPSTRGIATHTTAPITSNNPRCPGWRDAAGQTGSTHG